MNAANDMAASDRADFDSCESIGKSRRKQHSVSDESFEPKEQGQQERKLSDLGAAGRRALKKNRVSSNRAEPIRVLPLL